MAVVIDEQGRVGAVWLLQNFKPTIEYTNDTYIIEESDTRRWGYLQHDLPMRPWPQQRAGMKIAHSVADLSEDSQWTMDEYITGKYDIVQAVLAERSQGQSPVIVRQLQELKNDSTPDISGLSVEDDY